MMLAPLPATKLSATADSFVPTYCNPMPQSTHLSAGAQPFVPEVVKEKNRMAFLSDELGLEPQQSTAKPAFVRPALAGVFAQLAGSLSRAAERSESERAESERSMPIQQRRAKLTPVSRATPKPSTTATTTPKPSTTATSPTKRTATGKPEGATARKRHKKAATKAVEVLPKATEKPPATPMTAAPPETTETEAATAAAEEATVPQAAPATAAQLATPSEAPAALSEAALLACSGAGLPLVRSGVSGLLDDMSFAPRT